MDGDDPNALFTPDGSELLWEDGPATWRVKSFVPKPEGIRAVLACEVGERELARDGVNLWSARSRKAFLNQCPGIDPAGGELTLRRIEDGLKRHLHGLSRRPGPNAGASLAPLTPAEEAAARELLRDPALLYRAGELMARLGVAGEHRSSRILYLVHTSRLLDSPVSVILKADSAAGKSYLEEQVLALFPEESYLAFSGFSRQALLYSDREFSHKVIVVFEHQGQEDATYNVRVLQSEKRLRFEVTEKDPTSGQFIARTVEKDGPIAFVTTTTQAAIHWENETRNLSLFLDESIAQTLAIKTVSAQKYLDWEPPGGEELRHWCHAQRLLQPYRVRIPYAGYLAAHTPHTPLRVRRDFSRMLALIEVSALLHQAQRSIVEVRDQPYLEATLADFYIVKVLVEEALARSLLELPPNTVKLVEAVHALYAEKNAPLPPEEAFVGYADLVQALGWSKRKVSGWMQPALQHGLVENVSGAGRQAYRLRPVQTAQVNGILPSMEEMLNAFPHLAKDLTFIDPLTGEEVEAVEEET